MRKKYTALLLVRLALLALLPSIAFAKKKIEPRCFLHGIIEPLTKIEKGEKPLSNMIRLHFDSDSKEKCEKQLHAYCQYNVKEQHYTTARLVGSYKENPTKEEETTYSFQDDCKLISSDDP